MRCLRNWRKSSVGVGQTYAQRKRDVVTDTIDYAEMTIFSPNRIKRPVPGVDKEENIAKEVQNYFYQFYMK